MALIRGRQHRRSVQLGAIQPPLDGSCNSNVQLHTQFNTRYYADYQRPLPGWLNRSIWKESNMNVVIFAALLSASPQAVPAPSVPSAVNQPSATALSVDVPIETVMADPAGKAVIEKLLPTLPTHPMYEAIKGMTLRAVQPLSNGAITEADLTNVDTQLKAVKTK